MPSLMVSVCACVCVFVCAPHIVSTEDALVMLAQECSHAFIDGQCVCVCLCVILTSLAQRMHW